MIRNCVIASLRACAVAMGQIVDGTQWHLFGSVDRNDASASDIDLMILCKDDEQADAIRDSIDPDTFALPLHLALMTYDEAVEVDAIRVQKAHLIFASPSSRRADFPEIPQTFQEHPQTSLKFTLLIPLKS